MVRPVLLDNSGQSDDQVLETDIMRFVAIIGIVFWMIFALVKNTPLPAQVPSGQIEPQPVSVAVETMVTFPQNNEVLNVIPAQETGFKSEEIIADTPKMVPIQPAPTKAIDSGKSDKEPEVPVLTPDQSVGQGLTLQFASRVDLLSLLIGKRIRLFGRATTNTFDLFFSAEPSGNEVCFKGIKELPTILWEVKSGRDYEYYLDRLVSDFPALRTFPNRQIFVSFTDTTLEQLVEQTFDNARADGRNGILSVTRDGEVIFEEYTESKDDK